MQLMNFCTVDFLMKWQDVPGFSCSGSRHRREEVGRAALHPRFPVPAAWGVAVRSPAVTWVFWAVTW